MVEGSPRPRLAAILAADVAGYTRLMEQDTDGTVAAWRAARDDVIEPLVELHHGRLVKLTGDGFLAEFASVQDAVHCALGMSDRLTQSTLAFRMGINLGDIVDDGKDIHGEGVNVAARLESLAQPGGICISGEVHVMVRNRVPYLFEDLGEHDVKHVTHPVRVFSIRQGNPARQPNSGQPNLGQSNSRQVSAANSVPGAVQEAVSEPLPPLAGARTEEERPSIAVLPFDNMSADPEQEYFADGMVEDIITALSRARWLFVIARNSSFSYKGRAVDLKQVGRELGVRYILEGSVRKSARRVRINAQLIDTSNGAHLWAERFDGELEDIFDLQDRVTASVVGTIAPMVEQAEIERARRKPTERLDAYDHYLRGMACFNRFEKAANEKALALFLRAAELDPEFGSAYGMAARTYAQRQGFGWMDEGERERESTEARHLARHAANLGGDDAIALAAAGFALTVFGEIAEGDSFINRALALNPNLAWAWHMAGFASALLGRGEAGVEYAARAMRLSPQDPQAFAMQATVALGHFVAGRDEEAFSWAQTACRERANFAFGVGLVAATAAFSGRPNEAAQAIARLREINPNLRLSNLCDWVSFQETADFERWVEGLRQAGLPA